MVLSHPHRSPTPCLGERAPRRWSPSHTLRRALAAAGLGAATLAGCVPAQGPMGAAGADNQSLAEYDLARDAFQQGRLREALSHVDKALDLDGDNSDAAYLGAIVYLAFCAKDEHSSDCRYKDAEAYARRALRANDEMRDARNTLGVILVHQGRYKDAIDVLKPLAEDIVYFSPEKSWGNLGWAYLESGKVDDAIDALKRSVAVQPLFCVGRYRLGLAFERKQDYAAARDSFTKALETHQPECENMQDAYGARARVLMKLGLSSEARADLERCRDIASSTTLGRKCAAQLGGP